ncbi:tail fiber protein [Thalassospira sp.]|uniref:phage tail protein n=1 Tax=Thalassospira sp. TaxID=1912094 RepID=UPI0025ECA897|nr:tail fiber protein [Thalassospira sp.]
MKKTTIFCFLPTLAFAGMLGTSQPASACGEEAYTGETCITAASYCPHNTVEASGQILAINDYQALYSLVGCTFGGDCKTSFGIPDLRGRAPVSYGQGPGLYPHPFGQYYGTEAITQTIDQMPAHNHDATFTPNGGGGGGTGASVMVSQDPATTDSPAGGKYLAKATTGLAPIKIYNNGTNLTELEGVSGGGGGGSTGGTVTVGVTGGTETGGTQPMEVAGPRLAMRYCIVTNGLYPPHP